MTYTTPLPYFAPSDEIARKQAARQAEWDAYFMGMAEYVCTKSKDRSTQVGAVIVGTDGNAVLSTGWNGFPRGVDDEPDDRHLRPAKYQWTEHAERNAIYNAAREGVRLKGSTIYVTHMPYCDCARALVQSGISTLVTREPDWNDPHVKATQHVEVSRTMFAEAGIAVRWIGKV